MKADQSYFVVIVLIIILNKSLHADIAHNSVNCSHAEQRTVAYEMHSH